MDITHFFLIYAVVFRLSIIGVGLVSILLGYRLFCRGVWPGDKNNSTSVELTKSSLTLKNAAPGTIFSLFGAIIICVTFANNNPELTLEILSKKSLVTTDLSKSKKEPARTPLYKIVMRGEEVNLIETLMDSLNEKGVAYENEGKIDEAIKTYLEAVNLSVYSMNNLSWIYKEQGQYAKAMSLAKITILMNPNEPEFLDTFAKIFCDTGKQKEDLQWIDKVFKNRPEKLNNQIKQACTQ